MIVCSVASVVRRKSGLLRQEEPGGGEGLAALEHHVALFDRHRALPPFHVDSEVLVLRYRRAMWVPHAVPPDCGGSKHSKWALGVMLRQRVGAGAPRSQGGAP